MVGVFIIHGAYGNPQENWFPWLKKELENLGCRVFVPEFPTPEGQSLENWRKVFERYKKFISEDSIVIGHSLGPVFILSVLEDIDRPIKAAFFVSGFASEIGNPDFDSINRTFYRHFDWRRIRKNCGKFEVFHSDNDPYVPMEKAEELAGKLGTDLTIVKNAGHFNEKSGYRRFELLLEKIKAELKI